MSTSLNNLTNLNFGNVTINFPSAPLSVTHDISGSGVTVFRSDNVRLLSIELLGNPSILLSALPVNLTFPNDESGEVSFSTTFNDQVVPDDWIFFSV